MSSGSLGYRPELDGLRGGAIALVVLFHVPMPGGGQLLPGGWIGVDVFFALSGFLITTLLMDEAATTGTIRLGGFYRRRASRLLPALVAVSLATPIVLWCIGSARLADTLRALPAAILYYMNWYEASGNSGGLLSMTWSLAIEEQFYLVWPPVVFLLLRHGARRTATALAAGIVLYAWVARPLHLYGSEFLSNRAYFGTDMRSDALMLGCIAALSMTTLSRWQRAVATAAPAAVITILVVAGASFPAGLVLVAMLGLVSLSAAVVIVYVVLDRQTSLSRVLRLAPLVEVGRRSYGIYLWHGLAIHVVAGPARDVDPHETALILLITAVMVEASWRFIEQPFLRRRRSTDQVGGWPSSTVSRPPSPSGSPVIATAAQSTKASST